VEWNNTKTDYPKDQCIHQLFEVQATRSPEHIAVVCEEQRLSYGELNARANQLAHYLKKRGVGPEVLVGLCLERSLELVVGLLGILKAGGAYVPLDPSYPAERLAFMLKDTSAPVLLTQQNIKPRLPQHEGLTICLDTEWSTIVEQSDANPAHKTDSDQLAYVIYTSGSTGIPKGVAVPHRGVLRLVFGVDYACLDAEQSFLLLAPISFDASTFELWAPLLHGARCTLFPERVPTMESLGRIIKKEQITVLWLTASLFNRVIDDAPEILAGVRQLLTGGEALSIKHVRRAQELLEHTQLINGYGPTESTTFACCYALSRPLKETLTSVPIGRPISNTRLYILDAQMALVPVGVAGELYISGDGLARGYLNSPELTAERFIHNPFSDDKEARLYKTGDLSRYLPDGNIEFLGRLDHQVKIRGFRIELGEIEAMLGKHPEVKNAIVLASEDDPGEKRLVAYIVSKGRMELSIVELRNYLKEKLPEYMLPSAFVSLKELPLTPNGKVDRKALPVPNQERPELGETFVAPRTPVEELLAEIWAQVLGLDQLGINDNFFELGGHSLLATQVISRVINTVRVKVPLRSLFQAPTVADMAVVIVQNQLEKAESKDIDRMLAELEALSDEEARQLLGDENVKGVNRDEQF
jgi:amino acid adenylation domain-containing protein